MSNKTKEDIMYYNSDEYAERKEEVEAYAAELKALQAIEAKEKKKEVQSEIRKLKKIFTKDRCGEENMHIVMSLIERASFLRVEIYHMEQSLQKTGMMDFFVQGVQTMWREHPLSKVHAQHSKSYRETLKQLESYTVTESGSSNNENPIAGLIGRGNAAREKYKK